MTFTFTIQDGFTLLTCIVAIYGAWLSTWIYYQSKISIDIVLLKNMTSMQNNTTKNYFRIINKNKESVYIQSIWISLLWEEKGKHYLLMVPNELIKIEWLNSNIYESEDGFSLDKLKTVQVCTGHWETYKKHYTNIVRRFINR